MDKESTTKFCMVFAAYVKQHRKKKDLTRVQMAKLVGIDPSYVTLIERDGRVPTQLIVERLGRVLQVDHDDIMVEAGYATSKVQEMWRARKVKKK